MQRVPAPREPARLVALGVRVVGKGGAGDAGGQALGFLLRERRAGATQALCRLCQIAEHTVSRWRLSCPKEGVCASCLLVGEVGQAVMQGASWQK